MARAFVRAVFVLYPAAMYVVAGAPPPFKGGSPAGYVSLTKSDAMHVDEVDDPFDHPVFLLAMRNMPCARHDVQL